MWSDGLPLFSIGHSMSEMMCGQRIAPVQHGPFVEKGSAEIVGFPCAHGIHRRPIIVRK